MDEKPARKGRAKNPVSATTFQFGRIVRKWNVKRKHEEKKS